MQSALPTNASSYAFANEKLEFNRNILLTNVAEADRRGGTVDTVDPIYFRYCRLVLISIDANFQGLDLGNNAEGVSLSPKECKSMILEN